MAVLRFEPAAASARRFLQRLRREQTFADDVELQEKLIDGGQPQQCGWLKVK